ncbi:unnamed protein product [Urochloa humidicola]
MIGGGIGRSSATSYPEFVMFSPENYGHNMMGFHHHHHHPEGSTCGLPHEIQHPIGAIAADDMGIPRHGTTSSVVDMAGLTTQTGRNSSVVGGPADMGISQLKSGSSMEVNAELPHVPVGVGDAESPTATGTESLLVDNPQGHLYLQEVNVVGLPQPGPYLAATGATAAAMETPDSANALLRELISSPPVEIPYPWRTRRERSIDSLVVNAGGLPVPDEPDRTSCSVDVGVLYTATDKEIIDMVRATTKERIKKRIHGTEVKYIQAAEKDPTGLQLQEPVCYLRNERFVEHKTQHGQWKEKHRELVYADGVKRPVGWCILPHLDIVGIKITLEFHIIDGIKTKKTDWLMHEYIAIRSDLFDDLFLWEQKPVLIEIFNKNDKQFSQSISSAEDGSWMGIDGEATDDLNRSKTSAGKRRKLVNDDAKAPNEPSKVWKDFIRIYDKRPDPGAGAKLLYAACRHCHVVLKADNGTKSLLSHCTSCPCKKGLQPSSS